MPASEPRAPLAADCVDLVDKYDAGLTLFGRVEQVSHARRADADKHFHKVGTGNREEGHIRLSCDGFCKQSFTRSGRPDKQNAFRDARAQIGEFAGGFEKLDDFRKFRLFLFRSGDVGKTDFDIGIDAGLRLSKTHRLAAPALCLTDQQPEDDAHQHDPDDGDQIRPVTARIRVGIRNLDILLRYSRPKLLINDVIGVAAGADRRISRPSVLIESVNIIVHDDLVNFSGGDLIRRFRETDFRRGVQHAR